MSPARIIEDRLIKGSIFERVVYFVQGTPDHDLPIKIEIDDTNIKGWITTIPSGTVVIPKGTQQFPVTIRVAVPADAELGIYKGHVRASSVPGDSTVEDGSSGVSIVAGAVVNLEFTVGKGVYYEYAIRNIDLKNILETEDPTADVSIENKGNVPAGPVEASFELFNKYGDVRLAYVQSVKLDPVEPFQVVNKSIEFPMSIGLSPGEYWGLVKLYNDDGGVVREFKGVFNVNEATFFDKYGNFILWGVVALVALVLLRIVWKRFVRRSPR